ncbi:putative disease resistance rpp13-like protein 1 [Sesbania bispinosa]|nr:putative disease resistance rpp13-like protein 1 [Sesbania bispinosa]
MAKMSARRTTKASAVPASGNEENLWVEAARTIPSLSRIRIPQPQESPPARAASTLTLKKPSGGGTQSKGRETSFCSKINLFRAFQNQ